MYLIFQDKNVQMIQYDQTLELTTLVLIGTNNLCNQCLSVVCSIQQYVIKFVSDLRQVGGFNQYKWVRVIYTNYNEPHCLLFTKCFAVTILL
jgi:hypothetical protein